MAGPKRRIQERLTGFPDFSVDIEDMFSAHDKTVTSLAWRGTRTGSYAGIRASRKRVQVPDFASWRCEDGEVVEISTITDQSALLKHVGYFSGGVCAA